MLAGRVSCAATGDFSIDVLGGRGSVGGVAVPQRGFEGTITSRNGRIAGTVTIAMPNHPQVVPAWSQAATATMTYRKADWSGDVEVRARRGPNSLTMKGPLLDDGSYRLAVKGSITFAGERIPLRGSYLSDGYRSTDTSSGRRARERGATWSIDGEGERGTIEGVRVRSPRIAMTQAQPGVTGSGVLMMPGAVRVRSGLTFVDEGTWTLTANGSPTLSWRPEQITGLAVDSAAFSGTVASTDGAVVWAQQAPMTIVDEKLTMVGTFGFEGPEQWRLRMTSATGSILGAPGAVPFTKVDGDVLIDSGTVDGRVQIGASGALLAGLPQGWTPSTSMTVTFAKERGQVAVVKRAVKYTMSNKGSAITLSGDSISSNAFKLTASDPSRSEPVRSRSAGPTRALATSATA